MGGSGDDGGDNWGCVTDGSNGQGSHSTGSNQGSDSIGDGLDFSSMGVSQGCCNISAIWSFRGGSACQETVTNDASQGFSESQDCHKGVSRGCHNDSAIWNFCGGDACQETVMKDADQGSPIVAFVFFNSDGAEQPKPLAAN